MIASLERELNIKLLYRTSHRVCLTLEGERIFPAIQKSVSQYFAMQEIAKEIRGLETGVVRIGTLSSISCHWLPPLISAFQKQYPNVEFVLHQGDNNSIPEWVRTGEADFGFGVSILPELVLRKTNYLIAIRPLKPAITQSLGFIAKDKNELPLASKVFINFMVAHIDNLP